MDVVYDGLRLPSCPLVVNVLPARPRPVVTESASYELTDVSQFELAQSESPELAVQVHSTPPTEQQDQVDQVDQSDHVEELSAGAAAGRVKVSGLSAVLSANSPTQFTVDARQTRRPTTQQQLQVIIIAVRIMSSHFAVSHFAVYLYRDKVRVRVRVNYTTPGNGEVGNSEMGNGEVASPYVCLKHSLLFLLIASLITRQQYKHDLYALAYVSMSG